jgi:hypothetical protein
MTSKIGPREAALRAQREQAERINGLGMVAPDKRAAAAKAYAKPGAAKRPKKKRKARR